ncbi:MAG TPA: SGNH/GDSL hydrolase family protein [Lacunisphaera sp.]|nr:SGNH/GDSL hydrolase family protein [Lacunisphaera sp.]
MNTRFCLGAFVFGLVAALATGAPATPADSLKIAADNPAIRVSGRADGIGTATVTVGWSGARFRLRFRDSSSVGAWLADERGNNYAMAWVDGKPGRKFRVEAGEGFYPLARGLEAGEHTVELVRVTECDQGPMRFGGFALERGGEALAWPDRPARRIEFIGDSITCGYGVESDDPHEHFTTGTENFCLGYAGLTARRLDADYLVVARSGIGMVRHYNGDREGDADQMPTVYPQLFYLQPGRDWDASRFTPDVVCVNLGTNDFSTTGVDVDKFVAAYARFVEMLLARYPAAQVVALQGPMNTEPALKSAVDAALHRLRAEEMRRVHYLAFSPQGAHGYGADYHPNRAQAEITAGELTTYLANLLDWH